MAQTFTIDDSSIRKTSETVDNDLLLIGDSTDGYNLKAITRSLLNLNIANVAGRIHAYENFV